MNDEPQRSIANPVAVALDAVGGAVRLVAAGLIGGLGYFGGLTRLLLTTGRWTGRSVLSRQYKFSTAALTVQMVRFGVKSIPIIVVVQVFIGLILALQLAPTLRDYGQLERVAEVVGIAIVRELGPLLTAVVFSGFAGASIAAEIGAMVEGEEIKALRAHGLNPIRFLVVPRFLATTAMIVALTVVADYIGVLGGLISSVWILNVPASVYLDLTGSAVNTTDFVTGLVKSAVFGGVISLIACYEGFRVRGGPSGVGRATTATVVRSIVALIAIDALFTSVFYALGL